MVKWIMVMKIQPSICLVDEENHEKTPVRLVGNGIRTRDLPNACLVRYHGATSLCFISLVSRRKDRNKTRKTTTLEVTLFMGVFPFYAMFFVFLESDIENKIGSINFCLLLVATYECEAKN